MVWYDHGRKDTLRDQNAFNQFAIRRVWEGSKRGQDLPNPGKNGLWLDILTACCFSDTVLSISYSQQIPMK